MVSKLILLFLLWPTFAYSVEQKLLNIPSPSEDKEIIYVIEQQACSFKNSPIKIFVQDKGDETSKRELKFLEALYFEVASQKLEDNFLIFNLNGAKNIFFKFKFDSDKKPCKLIKKVVVNNQEHNFESLDINYYHRLFVPTLKSIGIHVESNSHNSIISLGPYDIDDYFAFYEVNLGMAAFFHSNIRPEEKRRFNRHDPIFAPMPTFLIRYGPLFINQDGAGSLLYHNELFSLLGTFLWEGEPYRNDGLIEREKSIFFGPLLKFNALEILYYRDLQSRSKGQVFKITLAPEFKPLKKLSITPRPFVQYWDANYVDYYFGVSSNEMIHDYAEYKGRAGINYGIALRNVYEQKKLRYVLSLESKFYAENVYHSPIMNKKVEHRMILGFLYQIL